MQFSQKFLVMQKLRKLKQVGGPKIQTTETVKHKKENLCLLNNLTLIC